MSAACILSHSRSLLLFKDVGLRSISHQTTNGFPASTLLSNSLKRIQQETKLPFPLKHKRRVDDVERSFSFSTWNPTEQNKLKSSRAMNGIESSRSMSGDSSNPLAGIQYRIANESRYEDVVNSLYANFFTDEPMSHCLELTDGVKRDPILDEFVYAALNENLTIMAIEEDTGKLVGACINVVAKKEDKDASLEESLEKYKDSKFKHIVHLLHIVNADAGDIYSELNSDCLFDIKMISAEKHHRKGGLATDLLRRSVDLAKCLGFKGVKTEATGLYSRKAFTKIGFEVKAECIYEDFVSMDGEKLFVGAIDPHRCTTLMTKRIQ